MDTSVNSLSDSVLNSSILPQELGVRLGCADAPLLIDVRREGKFLESPYLIASARRCAPENVAAFAAAQWALDPQREIVVYCVYGHNVSADAVACLRAAGLLAFSLGLSQLHTDDHAMLEAAMPLYDALFAWCSSVNRAVKQGTPLETHNWTPGSMTGAAK